MTKEQIIEIGDLHYADMERLGWIDPAKSNAHYATLVICEICEAIQAHRKGHVHTTMAIAPELLAETVDDKDYPEVLFRHDFEFYCKDTTADELTDTFLRLLSLYWMRSYDKMFLLDNLDTHVPNGTFTSQAMRAMRMLTAEHKQDSPSDWQIARSIGFVIRWAETLGIDLLVSCRRKMRYNKIRPDWRVGEKQY